MRKDLIGTSCPLRSCVLSTYEIRAMARQHIVATVNLGSCSARHPNEETATPFEAAVAVQSEETEERNAFARHHTMPRNRWAVKSWGKRLGTASTTSTAAPFSSFHWPSASVSLCQQLPICQAPRLQAAQNTNGDPLRSRRSASAMDGVSGQLHS